MPQVCWRWFARVGILVFAIALNPAFTAYGAVFTPLGFLSGSSFSQGLGVADSGQFAVGVSGSPEAFRWSQSTGIVGIGDLPGGAFNSTANGVSANGSVVIGTSASSNGPLEAFVWTSNGGMVGLGSLTNNGFLSDAYGVSGDGKTVVGRSADSAGSTQAFAWTQATAMIGLGYLPGDVSSTAHGASGDGSVIVGESTSPNGGGQAYYWTTGTGMVGIGDLAGGNFRSIANAISADGSVIVGQGSVTGGTEAFRWTASDGMVSLGYLLGGGHTAAASSTNQDGSLVVGSSHSATFIDARNGEHVDSAFIWDPTHGMRNLQDVLIADYGLGLQLAGWHLDGAMSISPDGQAIVGVGVDPNGNQAAWLVNLNAQPVPEPSTALVWLMGLLFASSAARVIRFKL